jgi:hypothetical protein
VIKQTSALVWLGTFLGCSNSTIGAAKVEAGPRETGTATDATSIQVADGAIEPNDAPSTDVSDVAADRSARVADAGRACLPLTNVVNPCPADWNTALADKATFCKSPSSLPYPMFDAFLSTNSCHGFLRYTKHLFDGGPRFCIYDPGSLVLVGYYIVDGKALFEAISCGSTKTDFDDTACAGSTCAPVDASSPPDEGG